jgi:hypothetical protein
MWGRLATKKPHLLTTLKSAQRSLHDEWRVFQDSHW